MVVKIVILWSLLSLIYNGKILTLIFLKYLLGVSFSFCG